MGALGDVRVRELTPERIGEWEARLAAHHNQQIAQEARRWLNRVVSHARVRGVLAPPERAPAGTVLAVAEDWQRSLQARYDDPDEGICRSYLSVPGSLIKRLGALAPLQVSELTVENVGAWYCELLKQYPPGRAYTSVVYLRSMIAHGRRIGFTIGDVTREIKRPEDLALPPSLQRKPKKRKNRPDLSEEKLARLSPASTVEHAAKFWIQRHILPKQRAREIRESTVNHYYRFLEKLQEPAEQPELEGDQGQALGGIRLDELTWSHVDDWITGIKERTTATAKQCLGYLRALLAYVRKRGIPVSEEVTEDISVEVKRKPARPIKDPQEMAALRRAIAILYEQQLQDGMRRKLEGVYLAHHLAPLAVLRVLPCCGAREHEICDINARDVLGMQVFIPHTKTHRPRTIGIDSTAAEVIAFQVQLVCGGGNWAKDGQSLFLWGRTRKALSNAVYRWMRRAVIMAGIPKPWPHPHDLRHSFVWLSIQMDRLIQHISDALGHANPEITRRVYGNGAQYPASLQIAGQLDNLTNPSRYP